MHQRLGRVLVTGGSGLLGRHVRELRPGWEYPTHQEFDVDGRSFPPGRYDVVVHAAAVKIPASGGGDPIRALAVNIRGTCEVVQWCAWMGARLVYVSTDYVFAGESGGYRPDDPVYPCNAYGWSKLGGECAVRMYDRGLIVRGSFGPVPFPYPAAFVDQYTSRIPVAEFALRLVQIVESGPTAGVIHVCGPARSVHEYATAVSPGVKIGELWRADVPYPTPRDTTLIASGQ